MFYIVGPEDTRWSEAYELMPSGQKDAFFSPQYAKVCAKYIFPGDKIYCAMQEAGSSTYLFPFVQRRIRDVAKQDEAPDYNDIRGLYGRSGLAMSEKNEEGQQKFWQNFLNYCRDNRIITSFGRVHPEMLNSYNGQTAFSIQEFGEEVTVNTYSNVDALLPNFEHAVRKNLRKGKSLGLQFTEDMKCEHLAEVVAIYYETLARNLAAEFYRFSEEFFSLLLHSKDSVGRLFLATLNDEVVSFEIVLLDGIFAHSFLGGTLTNHLKTQANTFLKVHIIRELHRIGVTKFFLGGGVNANDSLLKYKQGFSPKGTNKSFIETSILDNPKHRELGAFFSDRNLSIRPNRVQFYEA